MWEIIIIGICILVGTHIILRLMFGETVTAKHYRRRGYEKGYRDGVIIVKVDKQLTKNFICPFIKINDQTKIKAEEQI